MKWGENSLPQVCKYTYLGWDAHIQKVVEIESMAQSHVHLPQTACTPPITKFYAKLCLLYAFQKTINEH